MNFTRYTDDRGHSALYLNGKLVGVGEHCDMTDLILSYLNLNEVNSDSFLIGRSLPTEAAQSLKEIEDFEKNEEERLRDKALEEHLESLKKRREMETLDDLYPGVFKF